MEYRRGQEQGCTLCGYRFQLEFVTFVGEQLCRLCLQFYLRKQLIVYVAAPTQKLHDLNTHRSFHPFPGSLACHVLHFRPSQCPKVFAYGNPVLMEISRNPTKSSENCNYPGYVSIERIDPTTIFAEAGEIQKTLEEKWPQHTKKRKIANSAPTQVCAQGTTQGKSSFTAVPDKVTPGILPRTNVQNSRAEKNVTDIEHRMCSEAPPALSDILSTDADVVDLLKFEASFDLMQAIPVTSGDAGKDMRPAFGKSLSVYQDTAKRAHCNLDEKSHSKNSYNQEQSLCHKRKDEPAGSSEARNEYINRLQKKVEQQKSVLDSKNTEIELLKENMQATKGS